MDKNMVLRCLFKKEKFCVKGGNRLQLCCRDQVELQS